MFFKIKNPKFIILNILEDNNLSLVKWSFEYRKSQKKNQF